MERHVNVYPDGGSSGAGGGSRVDRSDLSLAAIGGRSQSGPINTQVLNSSPNELYLQCLKEIIADYGGVLEDGWTVKFVFNTNQVNTIPIYHAPDGNKFKTVSEVASHLGLQTRPPFPPSNPLSVTLPTYLVGDAFQAWEFSWRFSEVLQLEVPFSFEEVTHEFLNSVTKRSCLADMHGSLLKMLTEELLIKVATESHSIRGTKRNVEISNTMEKMLRNILPINELTWPEVARRYILAVLSMDSSEISFQCLRGDGCGSHTALEADAIVLAEASKRIFNSLKSEPSIYEWARILEPVRKLPTNNGSHIKKCINEALVKNPPEWLRRALEHSLSKGVYKSNAAGPTKREIISVLNDLESSYVNTTSNVKMRQCQIVLRRVFAEDEEKVLCNFLERTINFDEGLVGYPALVSRPLDFRSIDFRLAAGAYGGSHQAFFEDVQEVWHNIRIVYRDNCVVSKDPSLITSPGEEEFSVHRWYTPEYSESWVTFNSDSEIQELVGWLRDTDEREKDLKDSVLHWQRNKEKIEKRQDSTFIRSDPETDYPLTKALDILKKKFGSGLEAVAISNHSPIKDGLLYRCHCLEPLWSSKQHCLLCHQSFINLNKHAQNCKTGQPIPLSVSQKTKNSKGKKTAKNDKEIESKFVLSSSVKKLVRDMGRAYSNDASSFSLNRSAIHESALRPLIGNVLIILEYLKINLLDIEAAIPEEALRALRSLPERRCAWRAFTKAANTIYEMIQAIIILEDMIRGENLRNDWWYLSSPSAAAKTTTISALAIRIYALDLAIIYERPPASSNVDVDPPEAPQSQFMQRTPDSEVPESSSSRSNVHKRRRDSFGH